MPRIAIINNDKCKPKKCNKECKKGCPVNKTGKICIEIEKVATISEDLCIGCNRCVKVCPFGAVQIVNLPEELPRNIIHRFGENGFRLYKVPTLQHNKVHGILGCNGIGKSTIIRILSNQLTPNFEKHGTVAYEKDILLEFKKTPLLHRYFKDLYDRKLRVAVKHQRLDTLKGTVSDILKDASNELIDKLTLNHLLNSTFNTLSGGEQQRVSCCLTASQKADVYIFDEPTNYLDVKQRLVVSDVIRSLASPNIYVVVVDHDISVLDYVSDVISIVYGQPGAYGVVSMPYGTGDAINMYFDGYIPGENMRFRPESFTYKKKLELGLDEDALVTVARNLHYEGGTVSNGDNFTLEIQGGTYPSLSSVTLIMGENGCGKTTLLKKLAADFGSSVSFKPQYPTLTNSGSVDMFLGRHCRRDSSFISDVIKPLGINMFKDKLVSELSGGEEQRLAIVYCLSKDTDIYVLDEPSASLDIEQRVNLVKVIRRFIAHNKKIAFVVEHDISVVISLAQDLNSQVIVIEKQPSHEDVRISRAYPPYDIDTGMNRFLSILDVTFRKSERYNRHRINKRGSQRDIEQKGKKLFFCS